MNKLLFENYRAILFEIESLEREKGRILSTALSAANMTDMPKSDIPFDSTAALAMRRIELSTLIAQRLDELIEMRSQVEAELAAVTDGTDRIILRLRYVEGLSMEKIGRKINYSAAAVYYRLDKIFRQ